MTIEAGLEKIAEMGATLAKAVEANTENPGMFAVIERLIKALDRNTNVMLGSRGETPMPLAAEAQAEQPKAAAKPAAKKPTASAEKPAAKAAADKPIEYSTLSKKGLALIDATSREAFVEFLEKRGLANLKQAKTEDYAKLSADLDAALAAAELA